MNLAGLKNLDQFANEHHFFRRVSERPVLDQAIEQEKTKGGVFGQEEHRASHEMLMEQVAGLDLVQRDDHVLEEDDVFLSEGYCEP